ncbi:MAG TPA: response regulator [Streptosporangiaceae bacterium]|nr:response regulator [Streptosporangiaceae bacterium]
MTNSPAVTPRARILLVEDDPEAARFAVHVLGIQGDFDVTHTTDPAVAVRLARSKSWDLVVTDAEMPGMSGLELLEELRRQDPLLPVAVVTAHGTQDSAVSVLRNRADDVLAKPLRPDRLIGTAAALVGKGRAARAAGREVVLAIGAHPDDVEIGAAGTLLAHRGMGHRVAILTMSRGARGGQESRRAEESATAARILGAELYLEGLEDTRISEGDPTISAISRVVDQVRPTILYTHSVNDVHQDHRNTYRATMVAGRGVGRIYCFQSPSATVEFGPSLFVSIDASLPGKLAAISAFGSQTSVREYLEPDLIESTARYWGRFAGARYAEAFEVIRDRRAAITDAAAGPAGVMRADRPAAEAGSARGEASHAVA